MQHSRSGAGRDPLSGFAATAREEEGQRDDRRRRQEEAVIQSPAGAEERVDHNASEDEDEREHQSDTNPLPVSLAAHLQIVGRAKAAHATFPTCGAIQRTFGWPVLVARQE